MSSLSSLHTQVASKPAINWPWLSSIILLLSYKLLLTLLTEENLFWLCIFKATIGIWHLAILKFLYKLKLLSVKLQVQDSFVKHLLLQLFLLIGELRQTSFISHGILLIRLSDLYVYGWLWVSEGLLESFISK